MGDRLRGALVLGAMLSLATTGVAWSAGGGGGGGGDMPSMSAPTYDPAAEYVKGVEALNASKFKDAERALARVVAVLPQNAEAWRLLGLANAGQNDLKGARRAYEKAVKLEPDNIEARRGLGVALGGLKDAKAQAQLDWLKARALACGTCGDAPAVGAAVKAVESAIAGAAVAASGSLQLAGPAAGDRAYLAAVSLINERRYDEALASLAAAREALGPHPDILTYQGYTWRKKGQPGQAEAYYRQALAIAPDHRGATEYYGELKVERGDLAGARVMLARLDRICAFGCAEAEELRRWIDAGREPSS
ncbi:lipopolysaccharide assembly protein LapB [Phenylobacterium sp.]|uniref:Tetratricopeptide repeat protein n=1 Tax=Phenylobacterium ferrooxidans TaxID=2982689 RepID=A0ABW6CRY4_9CAUL|nr:tetratricopeptide repeat protein [Phenylobacterium sp.]MDO8379896.1 tetratricopeptide repeat protein [Phenylobacterium sp.]